MGCPSNDNAVWAYLGPDNVAILCSREKANEWWNSKNSRTQIKNNRVKGWGVSTVFWRFCLIPDGPPLFWQVGWFRWMEATRAMQIGKRYFGTIELALEFHAAVMAIIRKCEVPDGTTQETDEVVQPGFVYDDDEGEAWDAADWWKE
jgi:hypothetical protein